MLGRGVRSLLQYLVLDSFQPLVRPTHLWLRSVQSAWLLPTLDLRPPSWLAPAWGSKIPCGIMAPPPDLALAGVGAPVVQSSWAPLKTVLGAAVSSGC
ncbi:hypothetical protein NDU88_004623 [Pleurodeles waltl]|uniref:Uncharacterized protein n=1 Tax=Pleurodeles waltl TaxID=8319 RepID=A0AAV7MWY0_PLEWA|nr:hypothetical protein NDU88_004623 [Pleurodeles waltl]